MNNGCTKEQCEKNYSNMDKWRVSVLSGLIFLLISSPFLYRLVDRTVGSVVGYKVANDGCPTTYGLLLHTVVFVLVVRLLMR